jgi:hypothetical protein
MGASQEAIRTIVLAVGSGVVVAALVELFYETLG